MDSPYSIFFSYFEGLRLGMYTLMLSTLLDNTLCQNETNEEKEVDPKFVALEGGGIAETDKFDVISIQFAIHYMMSSSTAASARQRPPPS